MSFHWFIGGHTITAFQYEQILFSDVSPAEAEKMAKRVE